MKRHPFLTASAIMAALLATAFSAYFIGLRGGKSSGTQTAASVPTMPSDHPQADSVKDKKVLYWHDPMVPTQKFDKPGKSPFMDMQLVPVYAEQDSDESQTNASIGVNASLQQNLGMRTAEVLSGNLAADIDAVGTVAFNERDVALVQARSNGFVEKLFVRATLDAVKKGQPLAELYVPEWVAAQEEYLSVKRMAQNAPDGLLDAARQRLRLAGIPESQINMLETDAKPRARFTLTAPVSGIVTELGAREGMTVAAGAALFKINGNSTVWINADVPENFAAQLQNGTPVEVRSAAVPSAILRGKVSAILPEINPATRTLKVRIELPNPAGKLLPGMFANIRLTPPAVKDSLLVPSEAVIQTGTRSVVMLALAHGKFSAVDVETGIEAHGQTEIRRGLKLGQKVVVSGQFLIDSEASLKGLGTRAESPATNAPTVGGGQ